MSCRLLNLKAVEPGPIAALFSASVDNVLLSQWLDRQTFFIFIMVSGGRPYGNELYNE